MCCAKYALVLTGLVCLSGIAIVGCQGERRCESPRQWFNGVCLYPCPPGYCDGSSGVDAAEGGSDGTVAETGTDADDGSVDSGLDVMADVGSDALVCDGGTTLCDGNCVDTNSDPDHCGACGNACAAPANATATCTMGMCGFRCNMGWGNCDDNGTNGCETDLNSTSNCGMCGRACTAPSNATATCAMGACGFRCNDGYMRSGSECVPVPAPRPIAPLSTAIVTSQRPRLRWVLVAGTDGAQIELCRDRAMSRECQTIDAMGDSAMPLSALASGVWFWRLRGRAGESTGTATSPVWQFWVGARSAPVNTSWGTALDVNGDGYTDLALGSPNADRGRGRVDVFLGGPGGIASTPSVTLLGAAGGDEFGRSVASAGDVNGDGYGDLVVGARQADPRGRTNAGTASVYLGGPSGLSATPHRVLEGAATGDLFGQSVASAGDVNGDGYGDLVVGALFADPGGRMDAGTASVYLGSASGLNATPRWVLEGAAAGDWLGVSVASAGDVNGDGYSDLVVGAHGADPGGRTDAGIASVYLGSASGLDATPHRVLEGTGATDWFGYSVASAGDVNGDGYSDLVVGAYLADPDARGNAGTASVYLGGAMGLNETSRQVLAGTTAGGGLGWSVASAGDVNGDGYGDLIVGAPYTNAGGRMGAGAVNVYLGSASGLSATPRWVLEGMVAGDYFGSSVASAGNVNGDGYGDVVIGAHGADPSGRMNAGAVSVFLGGTETLTLQRLVEGLAAGDALGWSVAGAAW